MESSLQDFHSLVCSHDSFFSHVISMIPLELYKPEDEDEGTLNERYHKHRKLPLQPEDKKNIARKKKKEKYDASHMTRVESNHVAEQNIKSDEYSLPSGDDGFDVLRKRLQDRISALRGKRKNPDESHRSDQSDKSVKKSKSISTTPRPSAKHSRDDSGTGENTTQVSQMNVESGISHNKADGVLEDSADVTGNDILYSEMVESSSVQLKPGQGKPGSKTKRLQRMVEEAEKKRHRLEELKKQGPQGVERVLSEQWADVIQEASGEKVLVNTAKIKKAIKRREKSKEKSARQWQERISEVEAAKAKKQEKREENLLKRRRGADYVETDVSESASTRARVSDDKNTIPKVISQKKASNNSKKSNVQSGGKRAGFEGKKVDFLNKKS